MIHYRCKTRDEIFTGSALALFSCNPKRKKKKNNKQTKECIKILINTNKSESNKADNSADELTNIMLYILSTKEKQ